MKIDINVTSEEDLRAFLGQITVNGEPLLEKINKLINLRLSKQNEANEALFIQQLTNKADLEGE